jgi:1,4-dihydroxy-2-naphthoyl-CoA hydrolase
MFHRRFERAEMTESRADSLNEFASRKHPGMVGVEILSCEPEAVTGQLVVTEEVVAGTGFLWAPVVITLADWLCAAGTPLHFPVDVDASFTTIELKTNFIGSARAGETISGRAIPAHVGRTTQVWDVEVKNDSRDRVIALFRCTQMILYG